MNARRRQHARISRHRDRQGMILVITLAVIVLVTIAVLAFFSHAQANRQVEASRTNRIEAGLLARTGEDYVTGLFLKEISDPNLSTVNTVDSVSIFTPNATTNISPHRLLASGVPLNNTNFANLIRQSVPGVDAGASAHSTATVARNGRLLGIARWNSPALLSGGGFAQTNQLPNWVYVTRTGGVTNVPSTEVLGRFAYNVYDIGGLLDVNVAGYPSSLPQTNVSQLKSSIAGADLTKIGLTTNAINTLVSFRNPGTTFTGQTYRDAMQASLRNGFQSLVTTDPVSGQVYTNMTFVNRQDLLRYARTQNTGLTNALSGLTHYNLSVNAPSWSPVSTNSINPNLPGIRFTAPTTTIHYRDDGTTETYTSRAGEPLIRQRFSLAKLAWLTPTGPKAGISNEAIQACFGLRWDGGQERWDYVGSSGATALASIGRLGEVSLENREPNFFEILRSAILDGSVGLCVSGTAANGYPAKTFCYRDNQDIDASGDLQVLRIGANIIDCADSDNYPTALALKFGTIAMECAGIEDLPYLYSLDMTSLRQSTQTGATTYRLDRCDLVWVPEFFSPHQVSSPTSGPSQISFDIASGLFMNVRLIGVNDFYKDMGGKDLTLSPAEFPPLVIASTDFENFRAGPLPVRGSFHPLSSIVPYADPSVANVFAYRIFSYPDDYAPSPSDWPKTYDPSSSDAHRYMLPATVMSNLIVRMRYKTPGGQWKTYVTLGGNEAFAEPSAIKPGLNGLEPDDLPSVPIFKHGPTFEMGQTVRDLSKLCSVVLGDPRTSRFGAMSSRYARALSAPPATAFGNDVISNESLPFPNPNQSPGAAFPLGIWPQWTPATASPDRDTVRRPADAYLADGANPYRNISDMSRRPVVLQRPFQTVAELGYVSRDVPWKSLNFFHSTSGDAALLDVFSVVDEPGITAGRVNLNSPQNTVRQALISQTGRLADGQTPFTTAMVNQLVNTAYKSYAFDANGLPTATMPANVADLAKFMSSPNVINLGMPTDIKNQREAVVRSLAETTQTRTWNVLVDVVAQAGRFTSSSALGAGDFIVEGEKRTWLSLAIDRYTGNVVGKQTETVDE